ncbi:MAG TPA: N-acetylmuramic acid 6-phosphate etherase [Candidatus Kryptonia bacterium]
MTKQTTLFDKLISLTTESRNPASTDIDSLDTLGILKVINNEDKKIAFAVNLELPYIARAVDIVVVAMRSGGRLIYVGAGTSGRIGVQDAAECPPTFGTDPGLIRGLIAGGKRAVFRSQEGAEDSESDGANDVVAISVTDKDVVCGIAASRRTPYVVGAVKKAREVGAKTIFVTTNPRSQFDLDVDVAICPEVGPEVIMGSTRMKSGTAQKMVLNMLTTASMVKLGKVYENMMVDLQMTNEKLHERSKRTLMTIANTDYNTASKILKLAGGHVKTAVVMMCANVNAAEAKKRLAKSDGFVRKAIERQLEGHSSR